MKITKSQLKQIIKEELGEAIEIGGETLSFSRPPEPAKEILKQVAQRLSEIQDIDDITEDQAMDVLDVVIDSMQEIFHLGGFGTQSPVEEKKDHPGKSCEEAHPDQEHEAWEKTLKEKKKYEKSFYKAKDDRADHLISKGVPEDVAYGVADKQMSKAGKKKKKKRGKK